MGYYQIKPWEELTLQDDYMFKLIMGRKRICKKMLERILNIKIRDIRYIEKEKSMQARYESKGIRLDVYVEDDENTIYNIEMQVRKLEGDSLARRTRYYQSMIDVDLLDRGMSYDKLNNSYIIFICPFDPVGKGRHIYTFNNTCQEDKTVTLADGTTKMFLNTKSTMNDVSPAVRAFLDYVDTAVVGNDEFVQEINEEIKKVKLIETEMKSYMTYEMQVREWRNEGREEGLAEGLEKGRKEGLTKGRKEGLAAGKIEEKLAVAVSLLKEKLDLSFIMRVTELSADDIRKIAAKNGLSVVG